jgi:hypothetical protein
MIAAARYALLALMLVFSVACDSADRLTAPSPPSTGQPPPTGGLPVPPLTGPVSSTYHFSGPLSYPVSGYTPASKYLLYENGAFALQYGSPVEFQYHGVHTRENGRVTFDFSPNGRWKAIGTLNGDLMEVRYNDLAEHSDFQNAVYRRSQ